MRRSVISALRQHLTTPVGDELRAMTDEQAIRRLFAVYRGGLRLSDHGHELLRLCFKCYEFDLNEGTHERPSYISFLEENANMPYHLRRGKLAVYDQGFATWVTLCGGLEGVVEGSPNP